MRTLYATDASAYREMPLAVAIPYNDGSIKQLIQFAHENNTALIPRTAGTSLAGQVVGNGIIVDVSKHFTKILEVNEKEHWVRLQPGVIRDELNLHLKPFRDDGFFAPGEEILGYTAFNIQFILNGKSISTTFENDNAEIIVHH